MPTAWMHLFTAHVSPLKNKLSENPIEWDKGKVKTGRKKRKHVSTYDVSIGAVETSKTEQTEIVDVCGLGSRICAGAKNVIYGCIVPLLLAEWEVPSSKDAGQ